MFVGVFDFLNSREDAVVLWLAVVSAFVLYKAPSAIGSSVLAVIHSFFARKLLFGIWLPMTEYVGIVLFFAHDLGLWHTSSLKETLYWYTTTGLVLAGSATQASDPEKFWRLFGRVLKVTIFVEFVVNLYVFPLAVELVLVPALGLFVGVQVIAERDPKYEAARKFSVGVLAILGVTMVAFAIGSALMDLGGLLTREHLEQFVVPLALSGALVPFLYYVALRSTYEHVFIHLGIYGRDRRAVWRAKWALVRVCHLSLRKIGRLSRRFFPLVRSVGPAANVSELVRRFEGELRAAEQEERDEAA